MPFLGVFMIQFKKLLLSFLCLFFTFAAAASQDACTLYVHGFTGNPDGAQEQKIAFPNSHNYQAPALLDTQKETGFGKNRIIAEVAKLWKKNINITKAFMGQGPDAKVLADCAQKNIADQSFILFGICRGGCAAINYVAKYNPTNLKALIIESTPASMPALLHAKMAQAGIPAKFDKDAFHALFSAYPADAIPPVQALKNIKNKALPVLILHSKDDVNVPFEHALMLYFSFKEHGFENVFLVPLHGKHAYSLQEDSINYLTAVHSFYKHFDLAHDATYSTKIINSYVYDVQKAQKKINTYEKDLAKKLQKTHKKMAMSTGLMGASMYAWNYLIKNKPDKAN